MGRGRHPSSLASFGPDRSDRLHVYRWPVSHHPAHKTRALDRCHPEFREQAEDLFERVKDRVGEKRPVRLTGSYSIRAYFQGAKVPLRLAKIIIREDFPPDTYVDEAGVYVLIRADDWMAGRLDREPWTRVDLEQTIRIISVLFYGFRLGGRDDLDEIAAAIAAVVLELPPESGRRGARAPLLPHHRTYGSVSGGSPQCCSARHLSARARFPSDAGDACRSPVGADPLPASPLPKGRTTASHPNSESWSVMPSCRSTPAESSGLSPCTRKFSPSRLAQPGSMASADSSVLIHRHR